MIVHGTRITDEQIAAGLAAMKPASRLEPNFDSAMVRAALVRAGVPESIPFDPGLKWFVEGVAHGLLQRERKAGRIRHLGGGRWARVEGETV